MADLDALKLSVERANARNRIRFTNRVSKPLTHIVREQRGRRSDLAPVLIYTMEKVGTQTILATLQDSDPAQRVYMTHAVTGSTSRQASRSVPFNLAELRTQTKPDPVHIITAVRDPIARDVSLFFELFQALDLGDVDTSSVTALTHHFHRFVENQTPKAYLAPSEWFSEEFAPAVGFNPVTSPVDLSEAPLRRQSDGVEFVLFRLEDLSAQMLPALSEFLNRPILSATQHNRSGQKEADHLRPHYRLYREFLTNAVFDQNYMERAYADSVIVNLYTSAERDSMRSKWLRR